VPFGVRDALPQAERDDGEAGPVEGLGDRRQLGDDVLALTALVDHLQHAPDLALGAPQPVSAAQLEQEIFARGFAQGQQAGAAAAQQETAQLARKLAATLDDLVRVRNEMIRHTEKQMVQLALAVARRVVHREVSIDANVLLTMMRVALERVSDAARVTVRLNPADHQSVTAALADAPTSDQVTLIADGRVPRGGCKVESEYGDIDTGVDAQIQEIARALLGNTKGAGA